MTDRQKPPKPRRAKRAATPPAAADAHVALDLDEPQFRADLAALTPAQRKDALDLFRQLRVMTWPQVYASKGLHWEQIHSLVPPAGIPKWYSLRISRGVRARAWRQGNFLRFLDIPADHDATYTKR